LNWEAYSIQSMSITEAESLVNFYDWATGRREDGTTYRYKVRDCGNPECRYPSAKT